MRILAYLRTHKALFSAIALCGLACSEKNEPDQEIEAAALSTLSVESPAVADWLPTGTTAVSGIATEVTAVAVNGAPAILGQDGGFIAMVDLPRGINLLEITAEEPDGDTLFDRRGVINGEFANPSQIDEAVHLRLNEGGLDLMLELVGEEIEDLDIDSMLADINPVYEDSYGIWGWDAVEIAADIESIIYDTPSMRVTPTDGVLEIGVTVPELRVDVLAYGDAIGIDFDVDIEVEADYAKIEAMVTIAMKGPDHRGDALLG